MFLSSRSASHTLFIPETYNFLKNRSILPAYIFYFDLFTGLVWGENLSLTILCWIHMDEKKTKQILAYNSYHRDANAPISIWIYKEHKAKTANQRHRYKDTTQTFIYLQWMENRQGMFECIMHDIVHMPDKGHYAKPYLPHKIFFVFFGKIDYGSKDTTFTHTHIHAIFTIETKNNKSVIINS